LAVKHAKGKADYLLLFDADFTFVLKDENFKHQLSHDGYLIRYEGNLDYRQMLFVSGKLDWKYVGVTHEYITCGDQSNNFRMFDGFMAKHFYDGGSRGDKFERDVRMLEEAIKEEPDNARYMFYLAQSYKDLEHYTPAIYWYKKRMEKGGWSEEIYNSMYMIAYCKMKRGDHFNEFKNDYYDAYVYRPQRLEALYHLVSYCLRNNMSDIGLNYGIKGINTPYPSDILFVERSIHEWRFFYELALCAFNVRKINLSLQLFSKFISRIDNPEILKIYEIIKKSIKVKENPQKVAIIISSHNTREKTNRLVRKLKTKTPHDMIVVDNGSNLEKSEYTTIALKEKVNNGWAIGLDYADNLGKYFAYFFISPYVELLNDDDIITKMVERLNDNIVCVHPSLVDSEEYWKDMIHTNNDLEKIYYINNIFSCYRATWFDDIGRFDKSLNMFSSNLDICYKAYKSNYTILLDNTIKIKNEYFMEEDMDPFLNKYFINNKLVIENAKSKYDTLKNGLTFLIRAKNEEKNIDECLTSLLEITEEFQNIEIIVVDNNSSDKTAEIAKKFPVTLYHYNKDVSKIGNNQNSSISTFYNWCLDKVKTNNFIKWDADFMAHENLKEMIIHYNLHTRKDNFALWFTGITLFEHNNNYLEKTDNFYDSFKCFSKKHGFKWSDFQDVCEIPNYSGEEIRYEKPVFYEIFRTSQNEFENKTRLIDIRDKTNYIIFEGLKRNAIAYNSEKSVLKISDYVTNNRKVFFVVYYNFFNERGGTLHTLRTYIDYLLSRNDIVYIYDRLPIADEVEKLKPDCIISAQFASIDIHEYIKKWKVPHVVLTFAPNQYVYEKDCPYPSLITCSNSFIKSTCPERSYVVRDPINHKIYQVEKKESEFITLIGDPPSIKGHKVFIELAKRNKDLPFMLVTNEKYDDLPENIKLQPYLHTLQELKEKIYAKIKVLLLPSIQEAFGRVTIEATASDIPCILSDYPGLSEATFKMSNYVKDYKNVDAWDRELKRVLNDYENEVQKAGKIREKLDFDKDMTYFYDLISMNLIYKIYCFWFGDAMSKNRKDSLENLKKISGCNIVLVTKDNLDEYILPEHPLHESFKYLSSVHKADYLRTYFMRFHGGGYSDLKRTTGSWIEAFRKLYNSKKWIIGYKEIPGGVAYKKYENKWQELLGNGAYICKKDTEFVKEWYSEMIKLLDEKLVLLRKNPAKTNRDSFESGSGYPIEWNEMLGRIFHKVLYKYKNYSLNTLPISIFTSYK
jgi:glycosyltransferase involved in cell wall biosynthesis